MGGRFPALAVFGLPALTVAAALFVLWGLRPWEDNSDAPHEVPLGIETSVGEGRALTPPSTAGVAAGVVASAGPKVQAAQRVSRDADSSPAPETPSAVAVAPGQAVAVAGTPSSPVGPAPESGADEEAPSVGTTAGEVPPEGASSPAAVPTGPGGGASGGPVTAGAKPPKAEGCERDEYVIRVTFLDEESAVEEAPVEIVLEQLNEDGSTDELQLGGDLGDVHALASTLEAEGDCVTVEIARPEEAEGAEEVPAMSEEAPEPGEEAVDPAEAPLPSSP